MIKKTIVITGSTRGIGLEMATEFSRLGHQIVINGRSDEGVSRVITDLLRLNPDVDGVSGNVRDESTHLKITEHSIARFGKIDIWINNAGIPQSYKPVIELKGNEIKDLIDINIYGLVIGTRIAMKQMIRQGYGKIFNMEGLGSDGRIMNKIGLYGTTKRAVSYFTRAAAKEMKDGPVQIGILSPGMVRTEFIKAPMESATSEEIRRFKKVHDILAEDAELVAKFLVTSMLRSTKNYDRIVFLSKTRLMIKLVKMAFN
ncbi:SDR family NAD(P)-dependent oxidoreductase [Bacteroidota bacterium]